MNVRPSNAAGDLFEAQYVADNPWQMLSLLDSLHPDVAHLFAHTDNFRILPVLLHAPSPVIYDPYDCLQGMIKPENQANRLELEAERTCFARASHVCARSLEPLYLRRQFGYHMPGATYFPEYCWHTPRQRSPRQVDDGEELHVVYCGGVWPEDRYPANTHGYAQYLEVARALAQQKIHLHLYPAPMPNSVPFDQFFSVYLSESYQNRFLHIHHSLPYEELMAELPMYDAALHIAGITVNRNLGRVTRAKLDYSSANKLFDYIEAGLPVVIHDGNHQRGIVRHYGTSVEITDISQTRQALLAALRTTRLAKPAAAMAYQARRLGRMYRSVVQACASS
jgi:glycosyltransferase involved in cell wall biosynthesis